LNAGDYTTAAKAYEATLDSGELSAQQKQQRLDQLVKMYYQAKNYPKAIQFGNRYLKDVGPNVDIALLIAQSHYVQKDYKSTVDATQTLIKTAQQTGQPVKEDWLKLLMISQYSLDKDSTDRINTLEQLLVRYPSQSYWQDMLAYESGRSGMSDRQNLEIFRLKLATGTLRSNEYIEMAQLAMAVGLPGEAKAVLDKGFSSKVLGNGANKDREARMMNLAQTQSDTDRKALDKLAKEASAAPSGDGEVKLAEAYASYGEYDKAIEAFKRAFQKGNLKAADEARLSFGTTYYMAKRPGEAAAQFKAVPSNSKYSRLAKLWAIHTQNSKG
jgi:tetratricopeptide (TPR) repeat protein